MKKKKNDMRGFFLNFSEVTREDSMKETLYCECMGFYETEGEAISERKRLIGIDKADYEGDYDSHVVRDDDAVYEWDDGNIKQQYRLQMAL